MQRRDKIILQKIISEIKVAFEMLGDISLENFLEDEKTKRAVSMTAINIGELVKGLTAEFRLENNQVAWKSVAGFRYVVAHKYETLRMEEVYDSVKNEFPALKLQIEKILESDTE